MTKQRLKYMEKEKMLNALEKLVEVNEETKGARVIIDYAILLACEFSNNPNVQNDEMTDYVEELYKHIYDRGIN